MKKEKELRKIASKCDTVKKLCLEIIHDSAKIWDKLDPNEKKAYWKMLMKFLDDLKDYAEKGIENISEPVETEDETPYISIMRKGES